MHRDDRDRDEYAKERAREGSITGRPMVWAVALAAAVNSGKGVQGATQIADQALAAFDTRFVNAVPAQGDEDAEA